MNSTVNYFDMGFYQKIMCKYILYIIGALLILLLAICLVLALACYIKPLLCAGIVCGGCYACNIMSKIGRITSSCCIGSFFNCIGWCIKKCFCSKSKSNDADV